MPRWLQGLLVVGGVRRIEPLKTVRSLKGTLSRHCRVQLLREPIPRPGKSRNSTERGRSRI